MTEAKKFAEGDRVTGSDPGAKRWGSHGTVTRIEPELNYWRYFVRWNNGDHREHHGHELKGYTS